MFANEIRERLLRRPFERFRVVLHDGRAFTIYGLGYCALGGDMMTVNVPLPGATDPLDASLEFIYMHEIARLEPEPEPAGKE